MKRLIDANVILRYLLQDHEIMSEGAKRIVRDGAYTVPEVMAEVVYVLSGVYHIERKEIAETLITFCRELDLPNKRMLEQALELYRDTRLDFVDCVLISRNWVLRENVFSFDHKLNKRLRFV